jgi:hypothetical protein
MTVEGDRGRSQVEDNVFENNEAQGQFKLPLYEEVLSDKKI